MKSMVQIWQAERIAFRPQPHGMIMHLEDSKYDFLNGITGPATCRLTQPLGALVQQKFVHLAIEDSQDVSEEYGQSINLPHLAEHIRDTELSLTDIHTVNNEPFPDDVEKGDRTEATYNGTPVWIEWKPDELEGPGQPDGHVDPRMHACVKKLAARLKQNNRMVRFRAPHCLGYFVDEIEDREARFGLVFEKPASVPSSTTPTTLLSLIEESQGQIPSLTDRITLMCLLAETVERLHAVDWLHKGLRSVNILFFQKLNNETGVSEINYADPYISGFAYSLPAMSDNMVEPATDNACADIYRHPTVQNTRNREHSGTGRESYKKSFDLYSLGIVLLEIAHWRTIDQILSIDLARARPKHTGPVRHRLLGEDEPKHLQFVKSSLGNTVEGVIRTCLEGPEAFGLDREADERIGVVAAALQAGFGDKVVKRLQSLKGL